MPGVTELVTNAFLNTKATGSENKSSDITILILLIWLQKLLWIQKQWKMKKKYLTSGHNGYTEYKSNRNWEEIPDAVDFINTVEFVRSTKINFDTQMKQKKGLTSKSEVEIAIDIAAKYSNVSFKLF